MILQLRQSGLAKLLSVIVSVAMSLQGCSSAPSGDETQIQEDEVADFSASQTPKSRLGAAVIATDNVGQGPTRKDPRQPVVVEDDANGGRSALDPLEEEKVEAPTPDAASIRTIVGKDGGPIGPTSVEQGVVPKSLGHYSPEDLVRGLVFFYGPVAEEIPTIREHFMLSNFDVPPEKIAEAAVFLDKVVAALAEENPERLNEFRRKVISGDHESIQEAISDVAPRAIELVQEQPEVADVQDDGRGNLAWAVGIIVLLYVVIFNALGAAVNIQVVINVQLWIAITTPWSDEPNDYGQGDLIDNGVQYLVLGEALIANVAERGVPMWGWQSGITWQLDSFYTVSTNTYDIRIGDFNGDGKDDRLYFEVGPNGNEFYIFITQSASEFPWVYTLPSAGVAPVIGDFDGNGMSDILWRSANNNGKYWYFTSTTIFTYTRVHTEANYIPIVLDFNGDGIDDIYWYGKGSLFDQMLKGNWDRALTNFTPPGGVTQMIANGAYPIAGDFMPGGMDDILFYTPGNTNHPLFQFNANGVATVWNLATGSGQYYPFVGDFNNDHTDDIHWYMWDTASATDDTLFVWTPNTINYTSYSGFGQHKWYRPVVADFLDRGYPDIVWWPYSGQLGPI